MLGKSPDELDAIIVFFFACLLISLTILIFILFREDIFSKKDLALINSIKINYGIRDLSNKKLDKLISSWKPYNTIASLLLWKSIEEKQFYNN